VTVLPHGWLHTVAAFARRIPYRASPFNNESLVQWQKFGKINACPREEGTADNSPEVRRARASRVKEKGEGVAGAQLECADMASRQAAPQANVARGLPKGLLAREIRSSKTRETLTIAEIYVCRAKFIRDISLQHGPSVRTRGGCAGLARSLVLAVKLREI